MKRPRIIMAGIGLAALATAGGITAASEAILVNGRGLPLYFYRLDTATTSLVTGGLARLWPPLTSPAVAGAGVTGKVAVLNDLNGQQVTCNGHPLYTFAGDHAGQVTGQGVEDFLVATPGLAPIAKSAESPRPAPTVPSRGYGY
jgi:predicted lipoprotein with Yx(FWY)xxD motif